MRSHLFFPAALLALCGLCRADSITIQGTRHVGVCIIGSEGFYRAFGKDGREVAKVSKQRMDVSDLPGCGVVSDHATRPTERLPLFAPYGDVPLSDPVPRVPSGRPGLLLLRPFGAWLVLGSCEDVAPLPEIPGKVKTFGRGSGVVGKPRHNGEMQACASGW